MRLAPSTAPAGDSDQTADSSAQAVSSQIAPTATRTQRSGTPTPPAAAAAASAVSASIATGAQWRSANAP